MSTESTYHQLLAELKKIGCLQSSLSLLHWDEQVNLPPGSAERRAVELSALADIVHRERIHPKIGEWVETLAGDQDNLSLEQWTVVREAHRDYDRAIRIPPEFVAEKSARHSRAFHAWAQSRDESDFSLFGPHLDGNLRLAKEEAAFLGFDGSSAYDYHIDLHDPGLTASFIEQRFTELKEELIPLVRNIIDSPVKSNPGLFRDFPENEQEVFLCEVTARLGFDYSRGRIDRSLHPFCGGNGADTRMTTRYEVDQPLNSLFGSIHETGHGLYEQGLRSDFLGTGLGEAVGMAVHESQSRLWENQVGRSRAFWDFWEPRFREIFPAQLAGVSSDDLYLAINAVELNPIRVDSDEVTYNLHIILRMEIERRLFNGEIEARDLPVAWNQWSKEILGFEPRNDAEGCLQDVHWSGGSFGYFPSYCLGNMMAAQLWYVVHQQYGDIEEDFRQGQFHRLLQWLRENIHIHGRKMDSLELVRSLTGEELSPRCLLRYLNDRYGSLYL